MQDITASYQFNPNDWTLLTEEEETIIADGVFESLIELVIKEIHEMQNIKEGDNVVINSTGVVGTVIRMDSFNLVVEDENGAIHAVRHGGATLRQYLTEIENDGEDLL